jgi:hypothetical protein
MEAQRFLTYVLPFSLPAFANRLEGSESKELHGATAAFIHI